MTTDVGGVHVDLRSVLEAPVKDEKTIYTVQLVDAVGKAVTDARVTLTGRMADGMSVAAPLRAVTEAGLYRGDVRFTMGGARDLPVCVVSQWRRLELPLCEEVGR